MAKKKTVSEKIADVVDKVLHPEAGAEKAAQENAEHVENSLPEDADLAKESSSMESDYKLHPKFAKFNKEKG